MSLYATDLFDAGVPVSKPKKGKKEKLIAPPSPPQTVSEASVPVKKERSPAQVAAAEKMRAARQAKKDAADAEALAAAEKEMNEKAALEAKAQAAAAKKEATKEKRRLAKLAKEESKEEFDGVTQKVKRSKKINDDEPPAWFKAYMNGVQSEQNAHRSDPSPPKQVKAAAKVQAQQSWADPVVRDRVHEENNRHLTALHSQIFGNRKF